MNSCSDRVFKLERIHIFFDMTSFETYICDWQVFIYNCNVLRICRINIKLICIQHGLFDDVVNDNDDKMSLN